MNNVSLSIKLNSVVSTDASPTLEQRTGLQKSIRRVAYKLLSVLPSGNSTYLMQVIVLTPCPL